MEDFLAHLSTCSGIGGIDLAAERAGFTTVGFCEIDPFCQTVLARHWPHVPVWDDLRRLGAEDVRKVYAGPVALLSGGFPCTDLSRCRYGSHAGLDGRESSLVYELARLARELMPAALFIENVPEVAKYKNVLDQLFPHWKLEVYVTDAKDYGCLCRRERAFIVGYSGDGCGPEIPVVRACSSPAGEGGGAKDRLPMCLPWKGGPSLERLASCLVEVPQADATGVRAGDGLSRRLDGRRYLALGDSVAPGHAYPFLRAVRDWYVSNAR